MVQPVPPAVLSFRDQTPSSSSSSGRGWEVYTSPDAVMSQVHLQTLLTGHVALLQLPLVVVM